MMTTILEMTGMILTAHERISDISAFFLSNNAYWSL